jgi:hypothetical protein
LKAGLHGCHPQLQALHVTLHHTLQLLQLVQHLSTSPGQPWQYSMSGSGGYSDAVAASAAALLAELLQTPGAYLRLWKLQQRWMDGLLQQMQDVGELVVTQLPMQYGCNSPGCAVMTGPSEAKLVGGKGCVCGKCRTAR